MHSCIHMFTSRHCSLLLRSRPRPCNLSFCMKSRIFLEAINSHYLYLQNSSFSASAHAAKKEKPGFPRPSPDDSPQGCFHQCYLNDQTNQDASCDVVCRSCKETRDTNIIWLWVLNIFSFSYRFSDCRLYLTSFISCFQTCTELCIFSWKLSRGALCKDANVRVSCLGHSLELLRLVHSPAAFFICKR